MNFATPFLFTRREQKAIRLVGSFLTFTLILNAIPFGKTLQGDLIPSPSTFESSISESTKFTPDLLISLRVKKKSVRRVLRRASEIIIPCVCVTNGFRFKIERRAARKGIRSRPKWMCTTSAFLICFVKGANSRQLHKVLTGSFLKIGLTKTKFSDNPCFGFGSDPLSAPEKM